MDSFTNTTRQFYGQRRKHKRQHYKVVKLLEQNVIKSPLAFSHRPLTAMQAFCIVPQLVEVTYKRQFSLCEQKNCPTIQGTCTRHNKSSSDKRSFTSTEDNVILGPTTCWKIFSRQTEAFTWARQRAQDVLVFAFEKNYKDSRIIKGQRCFLVTSLDMFWHYYSQLEPNQRHYYEIIPEGCPCHLYFDLEFLKHLNPGCDGERMVEQFIQYVCMWLEAVFNVRCDRSNIIDLDASTEKKFSRHLIFHTPGAVFENNVCAGNFVRHIFGLLVKFTKLKSREVNTSPTICEPDSNYCHKSFQSQMNQGISNCMQIQPTRVKCSFDKDNDEDLIVTARICDEVVSSESNDLLARTNDSGTKDSVSSLDKQYVASGDISCVTMKGDTNANTSFTSVDSRNKTSYVTLKSETNIGSLTTQNGTKNCISSVETNRENHSMDDVDILEAMTEHHHVQVARGGLTDCPSGSREDPRVTSMTWSSDCVSGDRQQDLSSEMTQICGQFSLHDLQGLLVTNKNGNKTTFCDLGVYTRNRNFRLYLSSKLNQSNPLIVAAQNQFAPERTDKNSYDQAMFYASLVSNVRCDPTVQVLTFGSREQVQHHAANNPRSGHHSGSVHTEDYLEGHYCPSLFPEIDTFVESLSASHGCRGRIRHWIHFRNGDQLLYDITGCRWCGNVQREHRSNNIMYIVNLREGVYYQKCHDPDCQAVGYRSEAKTLPSSLLPSFFEDDFDDDNTMINDTGTASHGDKNKRKDDVDVKNRLSDNCDGRGSSGYNGSTKDGSPEDRDKEMLNDDTDDDSLLMAAVEDVELRESSLAQAPG